MADVNLLLSVNERILAEEYFLNNFLINFERKKIISTDDVDLLNHLRKTGKQKRLLQKVTLIIINNGIENIQKLFPGLNDKDFFLFFIKELRETKRKLFNFLSLPNFLDDCTRKVPFIHFRKSLSLETEDFLKGSYLRFYKIFEEGFKKILIRGQPGIGKTTHFQYLTCLWANNIWSESTDWLLLNITLRDVEANDDLYDSIIKQNFSECPFINKEIVELMLTSGYSENVILFIDGADELVSDDESFKKFLEYSNPPLQVVVWTRNHKALEIMHQFDEVFEILGFNELQIRLFLSECFPGKLQTTNFIDTVKDNTLMNFCKIPLLALYLFQIYIKNENNLPSNKYEIFSKITDLISEKQFWIQSETGKEFCRVCFESLSSRRIFLNFNEQKIQEIKLFTKNIAVFLERKKLDYPNQEIEFYHSSFQEYYAALFIIQEYQRNQNFLESIDDYFNHHQVSNLLNPLNFIKDFSLDLFNLILSKSIKLQEWMRNLKADNYTKIIDRNNLKTWMNDANFIEIFRIKKLIFKQDFFKSSLLFNYLTENNLYLLDEILISYEQILNDINEINNLLEFICHKSQIFSNLQLCFPDIKIFIKKNEIAISYNLNFIQFTVNESMYNKNRILKTIYKVRRDLSMKYTAISTSYTEKSLYLIFAYSLEIENCKKVFITEDFSPEFFTWRKISDIEDFRMKLSNYSLPLFKIIVERVETITSIQLSHFNCNNLNFKEIIDPFKRLKNILHQFTVSDAEFLLPPDSTHHSDLIKFFFNDFTRLQTFRSIHVSTNSFTLCSVIKSLRSSANSLEELQFHRSFFTVGCFDEELKSLLEYFTKLNDTCKRLILQMFDLKDSAIKCKRCFHSSNQQLVTYYGFSSRK